MEIAAIETMSREELIAAFFIALQKKDQKISSLQFQLSELQRVVFGSKSERSVTNPDHNQGVLFELKSEEKKIEDPPEKEEITYERNKSTGNKKPSRQLVPSHIPQVEIIVPRPDGTEGW